ncbi:penicillin-binding protein 2 [bacterium]|nr:penicillin-binding protein 2 [bacterium]
MARNKRFTNKSSTPSVNRLNFLMAIIFLIIGAILVRLFILQVVNKELYAALATGQHLFTKQLEPMRGRIFIYGDQENSSNKLYPIATNKDFALLYAVPQEVEEPKKAAEILYELLDKESVFNEIEELLKEDEMFSEEEEELLTESEWEERKEFKEIKRELETKIRKEEIINEYFMKLSKKNDPYEPLKKKVDEGVLKNVYEAGFKGIYHIMESHRYYPENRITAHFTGFVGYSDEAQVGRYGLEGFFDEELTGRPGTVKTERSAEGDLIIINDREYEKATDGSDLILTINRSIQYMACNKLAEVAEKHEADSGTIIVMEPYSGAILAMCSWPDYDPNNYNEVEDINIFNNPAIFESYEPGSIFKVFTMAAGINQNKVKPDTMYEDGGFVMIEGWNKPVKNSDYETHGAHGRVDMLTVLSESLNTGTIFVLEKIGAEIFSDYVSKFGFGEKTGIELETEGITNTRNLKRKRIRPVEAATASFGQGITVTPLQIVTAYSALANGGILMKPYLVDEIVWSDGKREKTNPKQIRRVILEKTALLVSGMMVNVVDGGHAKHAAVNGYFVAGKTGTAQVANIGKSGYSKDKSIHSFVGFAPVEEPKFVMLVKLNDPKDVHFSASSAAPLFGEVADFILNYYQVPKGR